MRALQWYCIFVGIDEIIIYTPKLLKTINILLHVLLIYNTF